MNGIFVTVIPLLLPEAIYVVGCPSLSMQFARQHRAQLSFLDGCTNRNDTIVNR